MQSPRFLVYLISQIGNVLIVSYELKVVVEWRLVSFLGCTFVSFSLMMSYVPCWHPGTF